MTTGVVIVANQSDTVDYPAIAQWNADRVNRYLGLPVTIITDSPISSAQHSVIVRKSSKTKNTRALADYKKTVVWNNSKRCEVYKLSPYDTTIAIDADYIVSSDQLLAVASTVKDFLCFRRSAVLTNDTGFASHDTFGELKMPMYWATVMVFKRTPLAEQIFAAMSMVEENYAHYAELYKFAHKPYRNDYALSIALNIVYGHCLEQIPAIPWTMLATVPETPVTQVADTEFKVTWITPDQKVLWNQVRDTDLHIMGKQAIEKMIND